MLSTREVILAKVEGTYNTDPTPSASTDAILVMDPSWSNQGARMNDRKAARPSRGQLKRVYGGSLMQLSFTCEIKGPGAAYSASVRPEIDVLLRCCALAVTVDTSVGSEKATYKPVSTPASQESCTIYFYRDGKRFIVTGCRGDAEFTLEVGKPAMIKFSFTGHVGTETDTALATPTFDDLEPPPVLGGSFAMGGYAAVVSSLGFKLNNKIATPPNMNASDGYGNIVITERDITGSFDPEDVLVATKAWLAEFKAGTEGALATGVMGATQYNRFKADFPVVYYTEVAAGDRDGIRTAAVTFAAMESSGDDEITLTFT